MKKKGLRKIKDKYSFKKEIICQMYIISIIKHKMNFYFCACQEFVQKTHRIWHLFSMSHRLKMIKIKEDKCLPICSICHQKIIRSKQYATICKHIYHHDCLEDWIKKGKNSCPFCRRDLTAEEYWSNVFLFRQLFS